LILALGMLAIGAVLVFIQAVLKPLPTKPRPTLQEIITDSSIAGVETRPLLTADLPALPPAPLNVTVLSVTISPGISSRPTAIDGPALVFVEQGHAGQQSHESPPGQDRG
jgi:hypothetical protein